jgi:hypothetical protein
MYVGGGELVREMYAGGGELVRDMNVGGSELVREPNVGGRKLAREMNGGGRKLVCEMYVGGCELVVCGVVSRGRVTDIHAPVIVAGAVIVQLGGLDVADKVPRWTSSLRKCEGNGTVTLGSATDVACGFGPGRGGDIIV